jgi:acyl carrier protein
MITGPHDRVEERLAAYLREECLPRNSAFRLEYSQNLFDAGIVISAGLISFISFIEQEFQLTVPDEDLLPQNFVSIVAIADYIRTHQQVRHVPVEEMRRVGS